MPSEPVAGPAPRRGAERLSLANGVHIDATLSRGLARETVEDVDQLGEPSGPLRLPLIDALRHALLDVKPDNGQADAIHGRLGGGELLEDVDAEPRLLDHPADPADLAFDAVESNDERLLLLGVEHADTIFRNSTAGVRPMHQVRRAPGLTRRDSMNEHSFMPHVASRRSRPGTSKLDRADKRDLLLRAAIETFAARGFFNAQVADVARTAGVAAGTVYLYFRGKDDLLISIFEKTMKEAIAEGRASMAGLEDPLARLRTIARMHLDRMGRDRALAIVFQVELRQSTKFMERFSTTHLREYLGLIRDVIADGQAGGAFRNDVNPTLAAKLLFGMLDEMATNWILSRRRYSLVAEADAIVNLFVHGLGDRRA